MKVTNEILSVEELPMLALRGLVIFPGMLLHFDVGRQKSVRALDEAMSGEQRIFLVSQRDMTVDDPAVNQLYTMGVVANIRQVLKLPGDTLRILVEGQYRAKAVRVVQEEPYFRALVRECAVRRVTDGLRETAMVRECRRAFQMYTAVAAKLPADVISGVQSARDAGYIADYIAANLPFQPEDKQRVLASLTVSRRVELLLDILQRETAILQLEQDIHNRVQAQMDENQKEYYLHEQMKAIAEELGEADNPLEEAEAYRRKFRALNLPESTLTRMLEECDRLSKMPYGSQESTVLRGWLDTCVSLPWNVTTKDKLDLDAARRVLDRDHYGMDKVKERVLEVLAVRALMPDVRGQVICLAGPPGVGKTSIARSIAAATGRKYVRVSLGGVKDESDIRGHRKTYVGSMPGRIIHAIKQAGSCNPVILLDEIDKMSHDFRGDPASAMLEVLDVEQNSAFVDHYLEVPFDLSQVLFVTTANSTGDIPAPLYDRMDVIEMPSYTVEEKFQIAKQHLVRKQLAKNGLKRTQVRFSDVVLRQLIEGYTREAGVRSLERRIAAICRKAARVIASGEQKSVSVTDAEAYLGPRKYKPDPASLADEVGVVNGLAWTSVGGETLPIEVAILEGTGKIELTGSLGDVMKESAHIAVSYVRSRAAELHVSADFYKTKDIHIHAPEGAVPKDGPSAGVTMVTALVSALTGIPVRGNLAMTGEISLRGKVLPIGGLREKSMAAYTHHMDTVLIPWDNEPDLYEVDPVVKEHVRFVPVKQLDTVLKTALVQDPFDCPHTEDNERPLPPPCRPACGPTVTQ
ncbi:MAG: endopeptidase La [Clostridia bacterium]|nr:endopeptidase La [Clostridia bacterium]